MYLIHIEKAWDNKVWENLLNFMEKHRDNCHLFLMPPQFFYQWSVLGYRGNEEQLKEILIKRYKELKELKCKYHFKIGLHFHISLFPEQLSKEEKLKAFNKACDFIDNINFKNQEINMLETIDGVVFGWFKADEYLKKLCEKKGLPIYNSGFHDYDLPLTNFKKLEFLGRDKLRSLLR